MPPELINGPYIAPTCQVGDWLDDELYGRVQVGGWTDSPIPWPRRKKTGKHSPILCGDLVLAVQKESVEAIRYYWGVGATTVWAWRQALGVDRATDGTRKLLQERTGVPPEAAARGRTRAASPESLAKMAETKRGKPMPEVTRKALLRVAKRSKSAAWGVRANAWMRGVELPAPRSRKGAEFTAQEEALLIKYRTRHAEALAVMLGRTVDAVRKKLISMGLADNRPTALGIRQPRWTAQDDEKLMKMYGAHTDQEVGDILGRPVSSVRYRARVLRLRR